MATQTLRQATFFGGVATVDVTFDDVTNIISSLSIVVTRGTLIITLSGSPLPSPVSRSFTGTTTFDLTGLGVSLPWIVSVIDGSLSWPVNVNYKFVGT